MKNLLHRILDALNINGRDWAVLLLALLLAFSIWMIHNLSLKYNAYLSVPVVAKCNIPGHAEISSDVCEVGARCRSTGYKLIRADIRRRRTVEVPFRQLDMKTMGGDMFYVTSADLQAYSHMIFGADVSVEYFVSDTLFFRFPSETFKKVPVVPISSLTYRRQYMADGPLEVVPDSILVYGEPYRLENVDAVYTRPIKYVDLSESIRGFADIEKIKGVRLSQKEVRYSLDVKRYVEFTRTVPVEVVNVPEGKELLVYPSSVEVAIRCNFPMMDDPERGLSMKADYNDVAESLGGRILLEPYLPAKGVISCELSPVSVSYIVEEKR